MQRGFLLGSVTTLVAGVCSQVGQQALATDSAALWLLSIVLGIAALLATLFVIVIGLVGDAVFGE